MPPNSIINNCSQFLQESDGKPLYRLLPSAGEGFRKIKMRKRSKHINEVEVHFDEAFARSYRNLRLRSMIVNTESPNLDSSSSLNRELFYIFPVDGYKILYNKEIKHYESYLDTLVEKLPTTTTENSLAGELFRYTYTGTDLAGAFEAGVDVLIYNIKMFYAIRATIVDDYAKFVTLDN